MSWAERRAIALTEQVENLGACVSDEHWRWTEPLTCDVCGHQPQQLYRIALSDGSTMLCGIRCASRLLDVTVGRVESWRRRKGPLAASSSAPPLEQVVR